jgi:probable F420-dependent oxidoreductase
MKVSLNLIGAHTLFDGRFAPILDVAKLADRKGIDAVSNSDHVALSRAAFEEEQYNGIKFPFARDFAWYEPIAFLSAIAAVTERVQLSTNVFIAPMRPAILLAKQLATLDVISNGRVGIGLGAGWQKQEFDAANIPFEGRFGYMEEQIEVCRALWSNMSASYHGKHINFDDLYSHPLPVQGGKLPIWLGLGATERNVERIARLADGWMAPPYEVSVIADGVRKIKAAMPKYGRDPSTLPVRALLMPVFQPDGRPDIDATFAMADDLVAAGATELETTLRGLCSSANDIEPVMDRLLALKGQFT